MMIQLKNWFKQKGIYFLFSMLVNLLFYYFLFHLKLSSDEENLPPQVVHVHPVTSIGERAILPSLLNDVGSNQYEGNHPGPEIPAYNPNPGIMAGINNNNRPGISFSPGISSSGSFGLPIDNNYPTYGGIKLSLGSSHDGFADSWPSPRRSHDYSPSSYNSPVASTQFPGPFLFNRKERIGKPFNGKAGFQIIIHDKTKTYDLTRWGEQVLDRIMVNWDKIEAPEYELSISAEIALKMDKDGSLISQDIRSPELSTAWISFFTRLVSQSLPFPILDKSFPDKTIQVIITFIINSNHES